MKKQLLAMAFALAALSASAEDRLRFEWNASVDLVSFYRLYESTDNGENYFAVERTLGLETSLNYTRAFSGRTLYYVTAVAVNDESRLNESKPSDFVTLTQPFSFRDAGGGVGEIVWRGTAELQQSDDLINWTILGTFDGGISVSIDQEKIFYRLR